MSDTQHQTYAAVTTFSSKGYKEYGERMLKSFDTFWPKNILLYVYWEQELPAFNSPRIVYRNLLEASPNLKKFIERNKNNPADESFTVKRYTKEGVPVYDIARAGIRFAYKSYAICHANLHSNTDYMIWIDADTVTLKPLPQSVLDMLCPKDSLVSYFGRTNMYTETGWVAYNRKHPYHQKFINEIEKGYNEDFVYSYSQAHDCVNFDIVRTKIEKVFNATSFNISLHYNISSTHPIINSPLGKYLDHLKGSERKIRGRSYRNDYANTVSLMKFIPKHLKQVVKKLLRYFLR